MSAAQKQTTQPLRILRLPEVKQRVGLGKTQIYELMGKRQFPRSVKLSSRATGWYEHEIDAFLRSRDRSKLTEGSEANVGAFSGATR